MATNDEIEPSPVNAEGPKERLDEDAVALCLSGGGYRAMVFHLGTLLRLNELGWLSRLSRVSSVSGGSITAAVLGLKWNSLDFQAGVARRLKEEVVDPVRRLADHTLDEGAILGGLLLPGSVADRVAGAYRKRLFGDATLQHLPGLDGPRFVLNATNVQTGSLWRFSRPYMADYKVGVVPNPTLDIATAVAASSAFPPVLSPVRLEIDETAYDSNPKARGEQHRRPFTTDVVLTDGGVYDNLGLETAWKRCRTIIVSDGGGLMPPEAEPKIDWARHALRVNALIDHQVRNLRKRQAVSAFKAATTKAGGWRVGTYFSIRSHVSDYGISALKPCPPEKTIVLAELATRLKRMEPATQERLINWGYAMCDVAMRRWVTPEAAVPLDFPYPFAGLG